MNLPTTYVGRLAPSPTGALHLGNARTFLVAWLRARENGGRLILRMEDLDHPKVKAGAAESALRDLRWLGFDWDEGPDVSGPHAPYVQSRRLERYKAALDSLLARGLVYPCICSRADVESGQSAPHAEDGLFYPGNCRDRFATYDEAFRALNGPSGGNRLPAWRFRVPENTVVSFEDRFCGEYTQDVGKAVGDFVIARHPEGAGYMLAVVVDDAAMGVTEVVRGDDLLPTTPRQLLLYRALGLKPPAFLHVPLVVSEEGRRLAKRHGDTRIAAFRAAGFTPQQVVGLLAWWCGWADFGESVALPDLLPRCRRSSLPHIQAVLSRRVKDAFRI